MTAAWIFVISLGVVLAFPLVVRGARGRFDPFEPIALFAVAYGMMFVARPAWMLVGDHFTYFGINIRSTLSRALLLALTGGVAFVCGYELRLGGRFALALPAPRDMPVRQGVVGSAVMGVLALGALFAIVWPLGGVRRVTILLGGETAALAQRLGAVGAYPYLTAMLFVPASLTMFGLALRSRKPAIIAAAGLMFAFVISLTVPLGARTFLLPLVGGAITFVYLRRGARPRIRTIVVWAAVALVASYILTVIRAPYERPDLGGTLVQLAERPDTPVLFAIRGMDSEMAPVLAAALRVVPSRLHYRYGGAVFGDLASRPIPRQLWHGKPKANEGRLVGAIWPNLVGRYTPAFSPLLYFYWDFGIPGVIAGMAVFGLLCRTLYEWFLRHRERFAAQLIFAAALWMVVPGVRNGPVDTFVLACFMVLPLVLLERLSGRRWATKEALLVPERASQR